jgi:hypothetical protein
MRKVSLAATLMAWTKLVLSGRKQAAEVPTIGPLLDALEERLARAKALDNKRARLQAQQQRVTRELREAREEGDDLMVRVRSLLKSTFGRQSVRLSEFDMRPHPQRYRRARKTEAAGAE